MHTTKFYIKNAESANKMSYIINDGHVNAGFKQQLCDFLLFQSRRNVQRRISALQFIQQHTLLQFTHTINNINTVGYI